MTLDGDVADTRARENQLKELSARKEDKEGHLADVLADALFNEVISVQCRWRGESQENAALTALQRLLRNSGLLNLSSLVLTAYHGYGRDSLAEYLRPKATSCIMIMPPLLTCIHPFVPASLLQPGRHNAIGEFENNVYSANDVDNVEGDMDSRDISSQLFYHGLFVLH